MMGFGGYVNGGSYPSPSSSNLSASAPPFPKPGQIPLVDLMEPSSYSGPTTNSSLASWLSSRSELNPSSNEFGCGGLQIPAESSSTVVSAPFAIADQAGYDWSSFSRVPVGLDGPSACDDYRQRLSESKHGAERSGDGLWNGFVDWKQSHNIAVPSMYENYMNPDGEIRDGLGRVGESSNNADFLEMGKFNGSLNAENSDQNSFSGKTPSFVPDDFSRSVLGSLSETQVRLLSSASHEGCVQDFRCLQNEPVFSSSKLGIYPERDDPNRNDASKEKFGPGLFNSGGDKFSLDLNINEAMISAAQETVDQYNNHGVDSPCWKGVPANRSSSSSSPFDASEAGLEAGKMENSSNRRSKQVFFREKSDENTETKTVRRSDDIYRYESRSNVEGEAVNNIVEEALKYCSARLHGPVENAISSSVEDTSRTDLNASISVPTIYVSGLVDTIHNLSNFLMYHCTTGSSRLKQKDLGIVQRVIDNLGTCMSKKAEEMAPIREPFFSVKNAVESPGGLQKAVVGNKRNEFSKSAKDNEVTDLLSEGRECNVVDQDKMTLAFKKVLTENFNEDEEKESHPESLLYKNLWLEAEAALCSVNYKARYNRMKIKMEYKEAHENSFDTETKKQQASQKNEVCSAPKRHEDDDVMARLRILKCRVENSNTEKPSLSSSSSSLKLENSSQGLSDSEANRDINDFDASVMARFHIIKSRAEKEEIKLPRFASQSTYWPILGSIPETGSSGPNPDNDCFTPNEFRIYDPNPEGSAGYDKVSTDWEHVRKEDLSWQNRY